MMSLQAICSKAPAAAKSTLKAIAVASVRAQWPRDGLRQDGPRRAKRGGFMPSCVAARVIVWKKPKDKRTVVPVRVEFRHTGIPDFKDRSHGDGDLD